MRELDWLLAEIAALRRTDPWGNRGHWEGGECLHQGCAVYRAADAVRAKGIPVPVALDETVCRWDWSDYGDEALTGCERVYEAGPVYVYCPSCGGRIVEVVDG